MTSNSVATLPWVVRVLSAKRPTGCARSSATRAVGPQPRRSAAVVYARLEAAQVALPGAGHHQRAAHRAGDAFQAVTMDNGVVKAYRRGQPIPLGDACHSPPR